MYYLPVFPVILRFWCSLNAKIRKIGEIVNRVGYFVNHQCSVRSIFQGVTHHWFLKKCKYSVSFVLLESDFVDTFAGDICHFFGNEWFEQCPAIGVVAVGGCPVVKIRFSFQVVSPHYLLKSVTVCSDSVIIIGLIWE